VKPPLLLLAAAVALALVVFFSDPGRANIAPPAASASAAAPAAASPQQAAAGQLVLERCGTCHSLDRLAQHRQGRAGWENTMRTMAQLGASWAPNEQPVILNYLVQHFGPR
jgi:cytochrome c5